MNFLAPLFLAGAAAIAAPILFHLIRRSTRDSVRFGSIMFLQPSPPRISRRHRVEHLWLLLLRAAVLLLVALAFARPFWRQKPPAETGRDAAIYRVILVDTSASMRRAGLWEQAKAVALKQLRALGPADRGAISTFDRQAAPLLSFDEWSKAEPAARIGLAEQRLATVQPGWSSTHLGNALIAAAEALGESDPSGHGAREIVLVSDLQGGAKLDGLQGYDWPRGVAVVLAPVAARQSTNAGLQWLPAAADASISASPTVRVRVTNAPGSQREQFQIGWANPSGTGFAGSPVPVYVPPGQSRVATVAATGDGASRLLLRGDDDDFDNTVYALPPRPIEASVAWLSQERPASDRAPLLFLRRAYADAGRARVKVVEGREGIAGAALLFVDGAVSGDISAAVAAAVRQGRTAVMVVRSAADASTLAALLGVPSVSISEAEVANYAMLVDIDFRHPLFAAFADPRFSDFTKIHVWRYRHVELGATPKATVPAKFDSGDPGLIDVPVGAGRVLVMTTGWQPDDSQLAISSKFVPLMWSMLEYAGVETERPAQAFVGDSLPLHAGATAVRLPDGRTETVAAAAKTFDHTGLPGIYTTVGGSGAGSFVVNLDPNESRTTPLTAEELEHLGLPLRNASVLEAGAETPGAVDVRAVETENRQKLWRWVIVATLVLLIIESAVARVAARRTPLQPEGVAP